MSFESWALLDRRTGALSGSDNHTIALTTTQSMVKSWIVADFLRLNSPSASELSQGAAAIVDSDDDAAQELYAAGGGDEVIERLIGICGLTETCLVPGWWSMTSMSACDAVRMGAALADGRAAGPQWTDWVLTQMRSVRGSCADADQQETRGGGRWGIVDALPSVYGLAIKNGWTRMEDGEWDVNCLALHDDWILAVLLGYSADQPLQHGADLARDITASVFATRAA